MHETRVGQKRGNLHSIVGRIGAETIVKSKRIDYGEEGPEKKFVNPLLLHNPKFEIQEVEPKEPTKKTKIYVLQKPAGLTTGAYLSCSCCGRHAFKLYRVVKRKVAPNHLKKFGATENDILRVCKRCWYQGSKQDLCPKDLATRPFFQNETPLGLTNRRACSGWHFLRRDFVRQKVVKKYGTAHPFKDDSHQQNEDELSSVVTLIINRGNSYIGQTNGVSLFSTDGTCLGGDEARYYDHSQTAAKVRKVFDFDRSSFESLVCDNGYPDNDITSALLDHDYTSLYSEVEVTTEQKVPKVEHSNLQIKGTADRLLKYSIKKATVKTARPSFKSFKAAQQLTKENRIAKKKQTVKADNVVQEVQTTRTIQNTKLCSICHVPVLKSYGSYKRENAPDKIKPLFTNGVIVVRACRRCIPYQRPKKPLRISSKSTKGKFATKLANLQKKKPSTKTQKSTVASQLLKSSVKTKAQGHGHQQVKGTSPSGSHASSGNSPLSKTNSSKTQKPTSTLSPKHTKPVHGGLSNSPSGKEGKSNPKPMGSKSKSKFTKGKDKSQSSPINKDSKNRTSETNKGTPSGINGDSSSFPTASNGDVPELTCTETLNDKISPGSTNSMDGKEATPVKQAAQGGTAEPRMCVICYRPLGKSYRRCTIDVTPAKYRYVFQLYKGVETVRICRKCLSRKSWIDTDTEGTPVTS